MATVLASLLPQVQGTLGWIFIGVLALMTGILMLVGRGDRQAEPDSKMAAEDAPA